MFENNCFALLNSFRILSNVAFFNASDPFNEKNTREKKTLLINKEKKSNLIYMFFVVL